MPESSLDARDIGLALSGGGSRAIAFHLGCFRALHDLGLLSRLRAISVVSGGAVIGAMYAYYEDGSFADFEARVEALLRAGLHGRGAQVWLRPRQLAAGLVTAATSGIAAAAAGIARTTLSAVASMVNADPRLRRRIAAIRPPFRRWTSRTEAFADALDRHLFEGLTLADSPRQSVDIVINACELRTGTAFRFGSHESGCWRYGRTEGNSFRLADVVAASAAYPVFLPALDRRVRFVSRDGSCRESRVVLTDGGVYENLGVSCFDPDRSPTWSHNVFPVPYVIACDAGTGQFSDGGLPYWWPGRMARSFEAVFRKSTDASRAKLHAQLASGRIRGFALPFLGQQDAKIPCPPADLVPREVVIDYPTDFAPMAQRWIEAISLRGEQLTRCLIARWCPDL